jgi:hypothetical protein
VHSCHLQGVQAGLQGYSLQGLPRQLVALCEGWKMRSRLHLPLDVCQRLKGCQFSTRILQLYEPARQPTVLISFVLSSMAHEFLELLPLDACNVSLARPRGEAL